jgi:benzoyl-CoA 2,3-epoxidase subunit B
MSEIRYDERIPNNVDLSDNRRLQRALESWQPRYLDWWKALGPRGFQEHEVYLRTAVSVDNQGWAQFGYTRLPEYRWGIFLADPEPDRRIAFGEHAGQPVWTEVPGEYRAALRRLIVIQGDTEPASVEQQRQLGGMAPSLYDLRNLLQINVEEGRHLWAMVYLLHAYFGRDGREEADAMLERHSGDVDHPRMLGAFNEPTTDWLSLFQFTFFTDRDGKFQLSSLAESGFDPLARTCRFMLQEEAHHMYVGDSGCSRVLQRTAELMREHDTDDIRPYGGIDLATFQRYMNFHFSVTIDLFGSEVSTNCAASFNSGLKGRVNESRLADDHRLIGATYPVLHPRDGRFVPIDVPALNALNERLRDNYITEVERGVERWNRQLRENGVDIELTLPHRAFNRRIGHFAGLHVTPQGKMLSGEEWERGRDRWLPSAADRAFVASLMARPVYEPGKVAHWIAAPNRQIDGKPEDFQYVRMDA